MVHMVVNLQGYEVNLLTITRNLNVSYLSFMQLLFYLTFYLCYGNWHSMSMLCRLNCSVTVMVTGFRKNRAFIFKTKTMKNCTEQYYHCFKQMAKTETTIDRIFRVFFVPVSFLFILNVLYGVLRA